MSETQELKCGCEHCGGRIAFPAGAEGNTINCPHCGKPTRLAAPSQATTTTTAMSLKCACRHCNGRIAFPPEAAGSVITCPHCGKETPLIAPGVAVPVAKPAAAPAAAATAKGTAMPVGAAAAKPPAGAPPPPPPPPAPKSEPAEGESKPVAGVNFVTCKECGTQVSIKAKQCPACGAPIRNMKRMIRMFGTILIVALVGAFVFFNKDKVGLAQKELEVVKYELEKVKGTSLVYVVGTLKNNTDLQFTSVRVDFNLFDKDGKQIGTASDFVMIIEPKTEWAFKAQVLENNAVKVKFDKITTGK
ncbi:MAG: FxLYD domain-containing protein [Verrucomicrobiota bacterium]